MGNSSSTTASAPPPAAAAASTPAKPQPPAPHPASIPDPVKCLLTQIPVDVLALILQRFHSVQDVVRASTTCRLLRTAGADEKLWQALLARDFPRETVSSGTSAMQYGSEAFSVVC